jgi:FtsX-like permease family
MLAPLALLVVMVTRVTAAERERRLAAIRLVGATRLQTAVIAAAETGLAAVAGAALAWFGYEVGRRILAATVVFQGGHFWLGDVSVSLRTLVLVLAGTPILVMLMTMLTLRRVQRRPLAVSRRGLRAAPSAWGALSIAAGLGGALALDPLKDVLGSAAPQVAQLVMLLTLGGFVLLGPWLCLVTGRGIARLSRGVPGLIAARRLAADPRASFRAVSGLVLAVTAVTYFGSTNVGLGQLVPPDEAASAIERLRPGVVQVYTGGVPEEQVAPLLTDRTVTNRYDRRSDFDPRYNGFFVPCEELARMRTNVPCPHREGFGRFEPGPDAENLVVADVYIPTDGSLAAENRVRTQAANLLPNAIINTDRDPVDYNLETLFTDFNTLARVASLLVLLMAAVGLTAGMIGGLIERRRPFALLRASGMRVGELRRVVFLETAATVVVTSIVGVALGLALAYANSTQDDGAWEWPGADVFGVVGGGVLATLVFSTLALPLLDATTRHDAVRYE